MDVLNDPDREVTIRLLPDGLLHAGQLVDLSGHLLRIDLSPIPADESLKAGDLVEVTCPRTFYLGEVYNRESGVLTVGIEHSLDRERLKLIQQTWSRSTP